MKVKSVLLILTFALAPALCAQSAQAPAGNQTRAEHRQEMMEMHQEQMAAMKPPESVTSPQPPVSESVQSV